MTLQNRYNAIIARFREINPNAACELHYSNPFELLCAVILSAQCTDKRVNLITPALFAAYPTPHALAAATEAQVFELIRSCSYPNNKAKLLLGMARTLVDQFQGTVPDNMDALLSLPGVGRKTANVILAVIFGQAAMAVDTHVYRVSERLGLTSASPSPLHTERTLLKHIPEEYVSQAHHWLILHGRYVCKARRPDCLNCALSDLCKHYGN